MVLVAFESVAWGHLKGYPWWPVFVINPYKLRPDLHHLGSEHQGILAQAKDAPNKYRIVYYFGSHDFGLHTSAQLKAWGGKDHPMYMAGHPSSSCIEMLVVQLFSHAIREVEDFLITDARERTLPYMIPSDLDLSLDPPGAVVIDLVESDDDDGDDDKAWKMVTADSLRSSNPLPPPRAAPPPLVQVHNPSDVPFNSLAWVRPRGYPWWPVYVCDPSRLRDDLHHLGNAHVNMLLRAKKEPDGHCLVYYFGRYVFGLLTTKLKPWHCADHHEFAEGSPPSKFDQRPELVEEFATAMVEAKACFATDRKRPTLPFLVESDLNKLLPAPSKAVLAPKSLAWAHKDGHAWLPAYVLDPNTLRASLQHLGSSHATDRDEAARHPQHFQLVYLFGLHEIILRTNDLVKPWQGPDHRAFVKGNPKAPKLDKTLKTLVAALKEAQEYSCADKSKRLPPFLTREDFMPSAKPVGLLDRVVAELVRGVGTKGSPQKVAPVKERRHGLSLAWIKPDNHPWWPVYVCDPTRFRDHLHLLGHGHYVYLHKAKQSPKEFRLIYYLGRHFFGLQKPSELDPWDGPNQEEYMEASPLPSNSVEENAEFTAALSEAQNFVRTGELPYLLPSDLDINVEPPPTQVIPYCSIAWVLRDGYPWLPAYVIDPHMIKPELKLLGNEHAQYLEPARAKPESYRLVFVFGSHKIVVLHKSKIRLRSWHGPEHDILVTGLPRALFINKVGRIWRARNALMFNQFDKAMEEVAEFIAQDDSVRMLPDVVAADMEVSAFPLRLENANEASSDREIDNGVELFGDEEPPHDETVEMDSVAWTILNNNGDDWVPVYVCDPFRVRSKLHHLGSAHLPLLNRVKAKPETTRLIYFFGSHNFGVRKPSGMMKPWYCREHNQFAAKVRGGNQSGALDEAEAFFATDKRTRLLPSFVPSDMDPSMKSPIDSDDDDLRVKSPDEDKPRAKASHGSNQSLEPTKSSTRSHAPVDTTQGSPLMQRKRPWSAIDEGTPTSSTSGKKRTQNDSTSTARPPVIRAGGVVTPHRQYNANHPTVDTTRRNTATNERDASPPSSSTRHGVTTLSKNSSRATSPVVTRELIPPSPAKAKELTMPEVNIDKIPLNSVAWARLKPDSLWWPVYICDPDRLQPKLKNLGTRHATLLKSVQDFKELRLVYMFGSTGDFNICKKHVMPWNCPQQSLLIQGYPSSYVSGKRKQFIRAVREAMTFFGTDAHTRLLPHMVEEDIVPRYIPHNVPQNCVAWAKAEEFPWLPVFVCDPQHLNPKEHTLGKINDRAVQIATENPDSYRIVYYFGSRHFGMLKSQGMVRWWNCPEHDQFVKGFPVYMACGKNKESVENLQAAFRDTQAFLASDRLDFPVPYDCKSERLRLAHARDVALPPAPPPPAKPTTPAAPSPIAQRVNPLKQMKLTAKSTLAPTAKRRGRPPKNPQPPPGVPLVSTVPVDPNVWTSNTCVAWARIKGYPWWPSYICDPAKLRDDLVLLGNGHRTYLEKVKQSPSTEKLVYYFGSHNFGLHKLSTIKLWNCPDQKALTQGSPFIMNSSYQEVFDEFKSAMKEVEAFLEEDDSMRLLPYMVPTDMDLTLQPPPSIPVTLNTMVWALSAGYPWMPAYVCDPFKLRPQLHHLGNAHEKMLTKAQGNPEKCWIVYYFGANTFGLHKTRGTIKPWQCDEVDNFTKGYAESLLIADGAWDEFHAAMVDAKAYVAQPEATRVLPGMVPSDMDPMLAPPSSSAAQGCDGAADNTIDLTSSPESTAPRDASLDMVCISLDVLAASRARAVVVARKPRFPVGHSFPKRHWSGSSTETDDEACRGVPTSPSHKKRSMQEKEAVADDFKYNRTQRQLLQELKKDEDSDDDAIDDLGRTKKKRMTDSSSIYDVVTPIKMEPNVAASEDLGPPGLAEEAQSPEEPSPPAGRTDVGSQDPLTLAMASVMSFDDDDDDDDDMEEVDGSGVEVLESVYERRRRERQTPNAQPVPVIHMLEAEEVNTPISPKVEIKPHMAAPKEESIAWAFVDGMRWWPVYIYDAVEKRRAGIAKVDVFHFGTHSRDVQVRDDMKAWNCTEHGAFVANSSVDGDDKAKEFRTALEEAMDFLENGESAAIERLRLE
ncbi:Aste57867_10666 [Aphanomyces stellatus]|uniref:Aste57867_10666 protein n=1 Tax=Aphanomyces stellatus TaxID=120398 RepID=A0A485KQZ1_9STRA|nr:hypothetical protein As57867_010626 [Aphanomyces stellatus]VFT87538.1 Aste57867_10666 [Aphanomyces stellatus]